MVYTVHMIQLAEHTESQWQHMVPYVLVWQKVNQTSESQQMLIVSVLEKIDRVITAPHCIWFKHGRYIVSVVQVMAPSLLDANLFPGPVLIYCQPRQRNKLPSNLNKNLSFNSICLKCRQNCGHFVQASIVTAWLRMGSGPQLCVPNHTPWEVWLTCNTCTKHDP